MVPPAKDEWVSLEIHMKIAIYGGAFDPVTLGHMKIVDAVLDSGIVDKVIVVPSYHHMHDKKMADYNIRLLMCHTSFAEYRHIGTVSVSEIEKEIHPKTNGTAFGLMNHFREMSPNDEFYLVIGQDNADSIERWVNGMDLIESTNFIVLPRGNEPPASSAWYMSDSRHVCLPVDIGQISSTMVREKINSNDSSWRSLVTGMVAFCIQDAGLYKKPLIKKLMEY